MTPTERTISIIYGHLKCEPGIDVQSEELHDLGADSLDVVCIVMAIEETLNIDISDSELYGLGGDCTVGSLLNLVLEKLR